MLYKGMLHGIQHIKSKSKYAEKSEYKLFENNKLIRNLTEFDVNNFIIRKRNCNYE